MTIGIIENPSLLSPLTAGTTQERYGNGTASATAFAEKLDAQLADAATSPATARRLAEALNLQMLHTTLSLAGDQPADAPLPQALAKQNSLLQSLLDSYRANQGEAGSASPLIVNQPATEQLEVSPSSAELTGNSQWLEPIITRASRRYGVDSGLIKAVIKAESNFNPRAVSSAGARGLMQLMPATARSLGVDDSFDPEQNVMAGTRFLRDLLNRYNGDLDSTLAAYNWGPGNVDKHPDRLPRETRGYLTRVKQLYASFTA